jgi:predicted RNase H-like nuclease (RuvC/YqgF family)
MGMNEHYEDLKDSLKKLRREIEKIEGVDNQSREKLDRLLRSIQLKLEHPQDARHHQHLIEQLDDAIDHFEVSHADLTAIMNRIMVTLGNLGI